MITSGQFAGDGARLDQSSNEVGLDTGEVGVGDGQRQLARALSNTVALADRDRILRAPKGVSTSVVLPRRPSRTDTADPAPAGLTAAPQSRTHRAQKRRHPVCRGSGRRGQLTVHIAGLRTLIILSRCSARTTIAGDWMRGDADGFRYLQPFAIPSGAPYSL